MLSVTIFAVAKRPWWNLSSSREEVFTDRVADRLIARRSSGAEPLFGYGRRGESGCARDAALAGSLGQKIESFMVSTYIRPSKTKINTITSTRPRPPPP